MNFIGSFRFLTYATALWAFLSLVATGQIHTPVIVLFLLLFIVAVTRHRTGFQLPRHVWTTISLIVFLVALFGWFHYGERLYAVTYFFFYLELNKLLTARKSRDYLQIYALTFFQVLAAAVSTESVLFAPMLAVYMFLIIAAMMTFTIKREAEMTFAREHGRRHARELARPRRLSAPDGGRLREIAATPFLSPRMGAGLVGLTVLVLIIGSFVFWIVPRTDSPNFLAGLSGRGSSVKRSAFTDSIKFTGLGEIQQDPTIVMRASPTTEEAIARRPEFLRIRGTVLDEYTGREWIRSPRLMRASTQRRDSRVHFPALAEAGESFEVRINLEPEGSGYLFLPDKPVFVELGQELGYESNGESRTMRLAVRRDQPITYTVLSNLQDPSQRREVSGRTASWGAGAHGGIPVLAWETDRRIAEIAREVQSMMGGHVETHQGYAADEGYLQLPRIQDMNAVRQLAGEWIGEKESRLEIARSIEGRLQNDYEYDLDVNFTNRDDHLTQFLTRERRGHCEYFATAMALMLRAEGIPARVVNGYLTDEWSAPAKRYIVRQEHAHSWVEAQIDSSGRWITFDPTPPSGVGSNRISRSWYHHLSSLIDGVKVFWYDRYVDYGLNEQRAGMFAFLRFVRDSRSKAGSGLEAVKNLWRGNPDSGLSGRQAFGGLMLLAGILLLSWMVWREWQRLAGKGARSGSVWRRGTPASVKPYVELLEEIQRWHPRPPAQTPLDYSRHLARQTNGELEDFEHLTRQYYRVRYSGGEWTEEMNVLVRGVRKRLTEIARQRGTLVPGGSPLPAHALASGR